MRSLFPMLLAPLLSACAQPAVVGNLGDCPQQAAAAQASVPYYNGFPGLPFVAFDANNQPLAVRYGRGTDCAHAVQPQPRSYDLNKVGELRTAAAKSCPRNRA